MAILITHDIELVHYAQKVVYLKDGEITNIKQNIKRYHSKHFKDGVGG